MAKYNITVPIFMEPLVTPEWESLIGAVPDSDPFDKSDQTKCYFGPTGRWLISAILAALDLKQNDEIAILTTSNEKYVSTCVSVTAFNYCKISRVITENTKVVIIIHEFGFIYPDIKKLTDELKSEGIVVIEDCAHIIGYEINGKKVGSFGDYSIFSLPKIIPAKCGGILRTDSLLHLPHMDYQQTLMTDSGRTSAEKYLYKYQFFNALKIERFKILQTVKKKYPLFVPSKHAIPFFMGFLSEKKDVIENSIEGVEWGATLRQDLIYIPTNPLVSIEHFKILTEMILNYP